MFATIGSIALRVIYSKVLGVMEATRDEKLLKSIIAEYPHLKNVNLSKNGTVISLFVLSCCRVACTYPQSMLGLVHLAGIEAFAVTLVRLDLSKNNLSIIEPITSLVHLTDLSLEQNQM